MSNNNANVILVKNTSNTIPRNPPKELERTGATILSGSEFMSTLNSESNSEIFGAYWNDLESDQFMEDNGLYRKRRFGHYQYNSDAAELTVIEGKHEFYQSEAINDLNGGKGRTFAPANPTFCTDTFLLSVIKRCLEVIAVKKPQYNSLTINTHLIRIVCGTNIVGLPTPEGIHRDGHCFVSQHLINRKNVYGGVSGIYNKNNEAVMHHQLSNFMDTIILDDNVLKHDVSPIFSADKTTGGYRDMLIIDYNFT